MDNGNGDALRGLFLLCGIVAASASAAAAPSRSASARAEFIRITPCPATGSTKPHHACPGFVVDHIIPLCAGGADHHSNMQWQTIADGKAKDADERRACRAIKQ